MWIEGGELINVDAAVAIFGVVMMVYSNDLIGTTPACILPFFFINHTPPVVDHFHAVNGDRTRGFSMATVWRTWHLKIGQQCGE